MGVGHQMNSIRALWAAVMMQAVVDYVMNKGKTDPNSRRLRSSAEIWLFESPGDRINSFLVICTLLGLRPGRVRESVRNLTRAELRQFKLRSGRNKDGPRSRRVGGSDGSLPSGAAASIVHSGAGGEEPGDQVLPDT